MNRTGYFPSSSPSAAPGTTRYRRPDELPCEHSVRTVAILGEGATGAVIARAAHEHGFDVVYQRSVHHPVAISGADVVVVGDSGSTHTTLGIADALAAQGALIVTTSRLPLAELASACPDPMRLLALRLPRHRPTALAAGAATVVDAVGTAVGTRASAWLPPPGGELIEVVGGPRTSRPTIGRAAALLRAMGITPLITDDRLEGFAAHLRDAYLTEGRELAAEGVPLDVISSETRRAGMATGFVPAAGPAAPAVAVPRDDIRDRLIFVQVVTAARLLGDCAVDPRDADPGSVLEAGFPASTGGVGSFVARYGVEAFLERADSLAALYGDRFSAPASLRTGFPED